MKKQATPMWRRLCYAFMFCGTMLTSGLGYGQCTYPVPSVSGNMSLTCTQTTTLTASGSGPDFLWFNQPTGGNLLYTGAIFTTPAMTGNDTFYVQTVDLFPNSQTFNYTGSQQTWTVPAGITSIQIDAAGAQGGNYSTAQGGLGGRIQTTLQVTPGEILYLYVGQQPTSTTGGWNGGGNGVSNARGGGGGTDIRIGSTSANDRVIAVGGGGGAGWNCGGNQERGGDGGGSGTAGDGMHCNAYHSSYSGRGATPSAGGPNNGYCGCGAGSSFQGGNGYTTNAGGGGGGYYGGGGAGYYSGGGGGSSYSDQVLTSQTIHTQGYRSGHGYITISWNEITCESPRIPVPVDVAAIQVPTVTPDSVYCGNTGTLMAVGSTHQYNWYTQAVGGVPFSNDSIINVLDVSTTTYYVEATTNDTPSVNIDFYYTGSPQTWTVPPGITSITVDMAGAQGGSTPENAGGFGGRVQTTLSVTPGDVLYLYVGGQPSDYQGGYNGGGAVASSNTNSRGGGGSTDIRIGGNTVNDRMIVAGGGGGAGRYSTSSFPGGAGGGLIGADGGYISTQSYRGGGGTQNSGGSSSYSAGSLFQGGTGAYYSTAYIGGGGGGGWYGGGGGYAACCYPVGSGGGGSSYAQPGIANNVIHTQGYQSGNGYIRIFYDIPYCVSQRVPAVLTVDTQVPIPVVNGITAICGLGDTIVATGSTGFFNWYDQPTGGLPLHVGDSLITGSILSPVTYYVEASSVAAPPYCVSERVAVIISPVPVPDPVVTGDTVICGDVATLTVSGSTQMFNWYTQAVGGAPFSNSDTITVTDLSTATYYVEATSNPNPVASGTYNYTGSPQTWTVPPGVTSITVDMAGAQGGIYSTAQGGLGGRVQTTLQVTPGETLYLYVGEQPSSTTGGWNGGGIGVSNARGGGGATDIRIGGNTVNDRVIVAGGGGGAGWNCGGNQERGGAGGGSGNAGDGMHCNSYNSSYSGRGATPSAGGGNNGYCGCGAGSFSQGGNGYTTNSGGGGGGYYGGGGAGYYSGGGGGSSYTNPGLTSNTIHTQGHQVGNGYITISYGLPHCTSNRIPVNVVVNPIAAPTVQDVTVNCGTPATLSVSGSSGLYHWYTQPSGGNMLAQGAVLNVPPSNTHAIYYVEAISTVQNLCRSNRLPVHVWVDSLSAPSVSGNATFCDQGSTVFTASNGNGTFQWFDIPGGNLLASGSTYNTGNQTQSHTYYVRYDSAGCVSEFASGTLAIDTTPDASILTTGAFCSSDVPFTLASASTGGTWSGSTGITNASTGAFDPSLASIGNNQVIYTASNGACSDADTVTLVINQGPDATIASAGPFCNNGTPFNLVAQTNGGTWSGTGITNALGGTFNPVVANTGTHIVTYSVTQNGCTDTDTIQLVVNPAPDASITSAPGTVCSNVAPFNLSSQFGGGTWSGTGITNPSAGTFDPSAAVTGNNTVTYTLTQGGCSDSRQIVIPVTQAPNATIISNPGQLCDNAPAMNLIAQTPGGFWTGPGITNSATGQFTPSFANQGANTVYYNVTLNGCSDADTLHITVNAAPVAVISPNTSQSACEGSSITLTGSGGSSYQWLNSGTVIGGATNPAYTPAVSGTYQVQVTNGSGCSAVSVNVPVSLNPAPVVYAINAADVCEGAPATFTQLSSVANTNGSIITGFHWDFGDLNTATGYQAAHTYANPGTYTVQLVVTTNHGCTDTLTNVIHINPSPVIDSVTAPAVCHPNTAWFNGYATIPNVNGSAITSYTWNFGDNFNGIGQSSGHNYTAPGIYTYSLQVNSNKGCNSVVHGTIHVESVPEAMFLTGSVCAGSAAGFTDFSSVNGGVITGWNWNFGDGSGTSQVQNPVYTYNIPGTYPVTLTVTSSAGCTGSYAGQVQVLPTPDASWTATYSGGTTVNFAPGFADPNAQYTWQFDDGTTQHQMYAVKTYEEAGVYNVCLTVVRNGCTSTYCMDITVTAVGVEEAAAGAVNWSVYPNPFNEGYAVEINLLNTADLSLVVYDMTGRIITRDVHSQVNAGTHVFRYNANELTMRAGVYVMEVRIDGKPYTTRILKAE